MGIFDKIFGNRNDADKEAIKCSDEIKRDATKIEYLEVERPEGYGRCSDDSCPCPPPGTIIPRGSGYLFIPQSLVDFRRDARSIQNAHEKMLKIEEKIGGFHIWGPGYSQSNYVL